MTRRACGGGGRRREAVGRIVVPVAVRRHRNIFDQRGLSIVLHLVLAEWRWAVNPARSPSVVLEESCSLCVAVDSSLKRETNPVFGSTGVVVPRTMSRSTRPKVSEGGFISLGGTGERREIGGVW